MSDDLTRLRELRATMLRRRQEEQMKDRDDLWSKGFGVALTEMIAEVENMMVDRPTRDAAPEGTEQEPDVHGWTEGAETFGATMLPPEPFTPTTDPEPDPAPSVVTEAMVDDAAYAYEQALLPDPGDNSSRPDRRAMRAALESVLHVKGQG